MKKSNIIRQETIKSSQAVIRLNETSFRILVRRMLKETLNIAEEGILRETKAVAEMIADDLVTAVNSSRESRVAMKELFKNRVSWQSLPDDLWTMAEMICQDVFLAYKQSNDLLDDSLDMWEVLHGESDMPLNMVEELEEKMNNQVILGFKYALEIKELPA